MIIFKDTILKSPKKFSNYENFCLKWALGPSQIISTNHHGAVMGSTKFESTSYSSNVGFFGKKHPRVSRRTFQERLFTKLVILYSYYILYQQ